MQHLRSERMLWTSHNNCGADLALLANSGATGNSTLQNKRNPASGGGKEVEEGE